MIPEICFFPTPFTYKCITFGFHTSFYTNYICVNTRINFDAYYKFYILIDKKICVSARNNTKVNKFNRVRCKEH